MLSSYKGLIKKALFRAGVFHFQKLRNRFYIIPSHMVVDDPNGFYPETSTKVFERQIEHIAKHYNVLPLEDIAQRAHRGRSVRGCVAITFDDG